MIIVDEENDRVNSQFEYFFLKLESFKRDWKNSMR